jgi:hypothetical protein
MSAPTQYLMPVWTWESSGNLLQRCYSANNRSPIPFRHPAKPVTGPVSYHREEQIDHKQEDTEASPPRHPQALTLSSAGR